MHEETRTRTRRENQKPSNTWGTERPNRMLMYGETVIKVFKYTIKQELNKKRKPKVLKHTRRLTFLHVGTKGTSLLLTYEKTVNYMHEYRTKAFQIQEETGTRTRRGRTKSLQTHEETTLTRRNRWNQLPGDTRGGNSTTPKEWTTSFQTHEETLRDSTTKTGRMMSLQIYEERSGVAIILFWRIRRR